jgi:hypothetical protein
MNQTFMRAILSRKLELIPQRPDAFDARMTSLDGAQVFVHLFLVQCLAVLTDENFQSDIFMISRSYESDFDIR